VQRFVTRWYECHRHTVMLHHISIACVSLCNVYVSEEQ